MIPVASLASQLTDDRLDPVADGRLVVKDLSGMPVRDRPAVLTTAEAIVAGQSNSQLLICANEGVLTSLLNLMHGR